VGDADPFLIALGLFRALEAAPDLPDPTVDDLLDQAEDEIGTDGLLSGWALVAGRLRDVLVVHAREVGCDCGSLEWLEQEQLHYAAQEPP
jgi:hypothetical protein